MCRPAAVRAIRGMCLPAQSMQLVVWSEWVGKVNPPILPAYITAADDHIEISLSAAHAARALEKIQPSRRNFRVRDKPVCGHARINSIEAAIAAIYVNPRRIRCCRRGSRRAIVLRAAQESIGIGWMLREA